MKRLIFLLPLLLLISGMLRPEVNLASMMAPAGDEAATNSPSGAVLPNGRRLTPRGRHVRIAAHPYGLALSPDGKMIVASCNGTEPFAVSIIRNLQAESPALQQIEANRERYRNNKIPDQDDDEFRSVFMGLAIAPDNRTFYASGGNQGVIFVFDPADGKRLATIELNGDKHPDSFIGAIAMTRDDSRIYALDQTNYRVAVIDSRARKVIGSHPTGRAPFSIALSPDEKMLYVTNAGIFQYTLIDGYDPKNPKETGLSFPPFGYPSQEMRMGGVFEGKNVAGLGDPNSTEAASVWS